MVKMLEFLNMRSINSSVHIPELILPEAITTQPNQIKHIRISRKRKLSSSSDHESLLLKDTSRPFLLKLAANNNTSSISKKEEDNLTEKVISLKINEQETSAEKVTSPRILLSLSHSSNNRTEIAPFSVLNKPNQINSLSTTCISSTTPTSMDNTLNTSISRLLNENINRPSFSSSYLLASSQSYRSS